MLRHLVRYRFEETCVLELHNPVEPSCKVSDWVGQFHTLSQIRFPQQKSPFGTSCVSNQLLNEMCDPSLGGQTNSLLQRFRETFGWPLVSQTNWQQ
jgi:hypothetical protein